MQVQSENELQRVVSEGREKQLTKELIVASLRQQGITDLDSFAERSLQAFKASEAVPLQQLHPASAQGSPEDARIDLLFGEAAQKAAKKKAHAEPRVPFLLRETGYKPSEIRKFEGKAIHFVWDEDAVASGLLRAVDDPAEMRSLLSARRDTGSGARTLSHVAGTPHLFFQHINFGGYSLSLAVRHAYPDLTRVTMSGWWFWAVSWNDQISSLRAGSGPITLADHILNPFLSGPTLTILPFQSVSFIGAMWNDRVSAILG